MARPKANYDNSKVEDDDETFDGDALTVRKAMQILEDGPSRRIWTDRYSDNSDNLLMHE